MDAAAKALLSVWNCRAERRWSGLLELTVRDCPFDCRFESNQSAFYRNESPLAWGSIEGWRERSWLAPAPGQRTAGVVVVDARLPSGQFGGNEQPKDASEHYPLGVFGNEILKISSFFDRLSRATSEGVQTLVSP